MMSAGVCIRAMMGRVRATVATVSTTLPPRQSQPALATQRRSPCMSRAPKYWAMGMANPLHTPMTKPRIR